MGCFKMEKSNAKNNSDFFRRRKTNQTWKPGFFPIKQVGFLGSFFGIRIKSTKTDLGREKKFFSFLVYKLHNANLNAK